MPTEQERNDLIESILNAPYAVENIGAWDDSTDWEAEIDAYIDEAMNRAA